MFVFQNRMGWQMRENFCEQFFQCANDNRQGPATVQTVVDALICALLDVCLDFSQSKIVENEPFRRPF